ncbi:MAG TPA: type II toxin-antitoxin system HicB family antitoxin [Ignavibacteria bacterium]|nr:type II toxin-antitoxin system HicB family antitoxin [Ignavibacteria bacterium]
MTVKFTLEHWLDNGWHVGKLKEVPGVFSQGASIEELKTNIREAYKLMMEEEESPEDMKVEKIELEVEV